MFDKRRQENQTTTWREKMWSPRSELPWRLVLIGVIGTGLLGVPERVAGQGLLPTINVPSTFNPGPHDHIFFWGIVSHQPWHKPFPLHPTGHRPLPPAG